MLQISMKGYKLAPEAYRQELFQRMISNSCQFCSSQGTTISKAVYITQISQKTSACFDRRIQKLLSQSCQNLCGGTESCTLVQLADDLPLIHNVSLTLAMVSPVFARSLNHLL